MSNDGFEQRLNQGPAGDAADYAKGSGADSEVKHDKAVDNQAVMSAVQRQGNRVFGFPAESQGDDAERRSAEK
jgi:hypothetical protein